MKNTTLMLPGFHPSSLRRKPQTKAQKLAQALDKIKKHSINQSKGGQVSLLIILPDLCRKSRIKR